MCDICARARARGTEELETIRLAVEVVQRDVCGKTFCDWRAKFTTVAQNDGARQPVRPRGRRFVTGLWTLAVLPLVSDSA